MTSGGRSKGLFVLLRLCRRGWDPGLPVQVRYESDCQTSDVSGWSLGLCFFLAKRNEPHEPFALLLPMTGTGTVPVPVRWTDGGQAWYSGGGIAMRRESGVGVGAPSPTNRGRNPGVIL